MKPLNRVKFKLYLKETPQYIFVLSIIALIAFLTSKYIGAVCFVVSFLRLRYKFSNTFHCSTTAKCLACTIAIALFSIYILFPVKISLLSSVIVAFMMTYALWFIADYFTKSKKLIKSESLTDRQKAVYDAIQRGIVGEKQIDYILSLGFDYSGSTQDREYKEIKRKLGLKTIK